METIDRQFLIGGGKIQNVEWLRFIAVLSLVFWHSICVYTGWNNYLPSITEVVGDSFYTKIYTILAKVFLPDANMPLFVTISGFVYYYLRFYKSKYRDTYEFIKNKARRLLIPYFIIGTIVLHTIFDWNNKSFINGDAYLLWFCSMLFWCFIGIRIYEIIPKWPKPFIVMGCLISGFVVLPIDFLYVYRSLHYFPCFLIGYYLVNYLHVIQAKSLYKICIVLGALVFLVLSISNIKYVNTLCRICYNYVFPIMLFSVIPINIKSNKLISLINAYSFGVYVFHEWILWNAAHLSILESVIISHQILYPVIMYFTVLFLSLGLTHLCLKTKVGKFLLGG